MSSILERLGLTDGCEREITVGKSFYGNGHTEYHTFRYDFKPASVDFTKMATVDIGEGNQVTVTVPHVDRGSGTTHTVFKGSKKPYRKECVLIIDHKTGEITLEKLSYNVQLKKTRAEGSSKISQSFLENNLTTKMSPLQRRSPQQRSLLPASSSTATSSKCSPFSSKSPNSQQSQSSPPSRASPSVPCIAPASGPSALLKHSNQTAPVASTSKADTVMQELGVGVMSSSGSSNDSSGSSSSDSESSEDENASNAKMQGLTNGKSGVSKSMPNVVSSASKLKGINVSNSRPPSRNGSPTMPRFPQSSPKAAGHSSSNSSSSKFNGNSSFPPQVKIIPKVNGNVVLPFRANGNINFSKKIKPVSQPPPILSMPKLSLLSEDLQLSESDSD